MLSLQLHNCLYQGSFFFNVYLNCWGHLFLIWTSGISCKIGLLAANCFYLYLFPFLKDNFVGHHILSFLLWALWIWCSTASSVQSFLMRSCLLLYWASVDVVKIFSLSLALNTFTMSGYDLCIYFRLGILDVWVTVF